MSTKIYVAFRIPLGKLSEYIAYFDYVQLMFTAKKIQELAGALKSKRVTTEGLGNVLDKCADPPDTADGFNYHVDCGYGMWIDKRYAYIIPYGHGLRELVYRKPITEGYSYSYWNNSDKPESVSEAEWRRRGKAWGAILSGGPITGEWACKLIHETIALQDKNIRTRHELRIYDALRKRRCKILRKDGTEVK